MQSLELKRVTMLFTLFYRPSFVTFSTSPPARDSFHHIDVVLLYDPSETLMRFSEREVTLQDSKMSEQRSSQEWIIDTQ